MQRLRQWFSTQSRMVQVILSVAVVGAAVLLSPLLVFVAGLALFVSIVALLYRVFHHRPVRAWGAAAGVFLVLTLALGGISAALYGTGSNQTKSTAPPKKEQAASKNTARRANAGRANKEVARARQEAESAKKEATRAKKEAEQARKAKAKAESALKEKTTPKTAKSVGARSTKKPPPTKTLEQQLQAGIKKTFVEPKDVQGIQLVPSGAGCYNVTVGFSGQGFTAGGTVDNIETQMEDVYTAIYSKPDLANIVCGATLSASSGLTDKFGNTTNETLLSTSINSTTAQSINWKNSYSVDFPNVWTVNYENPAFAQQKAQNAAQQAKKCADGGGLFGFLTCP